MKDRLKEKPTTILPAVTRFAHEEESYQAFLLLESFADGFGGWRVLDVLGKPITELPDDLVSDLLKWRTITAIIREGIRKEDVESE